MFHLAPHASDWYSPVYHIRWRVGGVVTQRIANPCTPVRFRYSPPNTRNSFFKIDSLCNLNAETCNLKRYI